MMKQCPRFNSCSINVCPLDPEAKYRCNLPGENRCPFTIKKKSIFQKGIKTQMSYHLLELIPEPNIKTLNRGNLKRWCALHKKDGTK
jgi:hypothetical protein